MRPGLLALLLVAACGGQPGLPTDGGEHDAPPAARPPHGMWVYKLLADDPDNPSAPARLLETDPDAAALRAFASAHDIGELYLAVGSDALAHPALPGFVGALERDGFRVEALIDTTAYADPLPVLDEIQAYDASRADAEERFDGVHLDFEPWIGTGDDFRWVAELRAKVEAVHQALGGSGLGLAVDMSGTKILSADPLMVADRQGLLDAATHLVLMEYEMSEADVEMRVDRFLEWADLSTARFTVATRVHDFGGSAWVGGACANGAVLERLDARHAATPGYRGWATFAYNWYFRVYPASFPDATVIGLPVCPTEACCAIP